MLEELGITLGWTEQLQGSLKGSERGEQSAMAVDGVLGGRLTQGVIVIPDSPAEEAEDDGGMGAEEENGGAEFVGVVQGELVSGYTTEEDGVEEGALVMAAQVIPALPGDTLCQLPGCFLPVYVSREGERFDYCSRTHATRARFPSREMLSEVCKLPGCEERVCVDTDGTPFEFCCRSHGREFQVLQSGMESSEVGRRSGGAGRGGSGNVANLNEFSTSSSLVCVKPGCLCKVKSPHDGVKRGRMGRGPTRYNFCSQECKHELGLGPDTVPYSTTVPLSRAWYLDQVVAALQERDLAEEGKLGESEQEGEVEAGAPSAETLRLTQVPPQSFAAEAVSSVMRCQGLMRRLMAKRQFPFLAKYNGRTECPLCERKIKTGEGMVRCYVDPRPECQWVHVSCAQAVVTAKGGCPLHPSLA